MRRMLSLTSALAGSTSACACWLVGGHTSGCLPGTYSLYPKSLDEKVIIDLLYNRRGDQYPDFIIVTADAANLRRNLLLFTQLADLRIPAVLVLTMTDVSGRRLDNNLWAYLATMFIVFAAACASPRGLLPLTGRVPVYLGEISFAIYIFHYPVLCVLRWTVGTRLDAMAEHATVTEARLVIVAALAVVMGVAVVAHHLVEKPARRLARRGR